MGTRGGTGKDRELTLRCSLLVVTLQESPFYKWQARSLKKISEVEQAGDGSRVSGTMCHLQTCGPLGLPREEFTILRFLGVGIGICVLTSKSLLKLPL